MKKFLINNKFKLYLILFSYLTFHVFNSSYLGFYYDDWFFVNTFNNSTSLINNYNILKEIYIVRPVAFIYLFLLSLFKFENFNFIYLLNILIWLTSSIILAYSLKKIIKDFNINFFLLFLLFPSISNTFIYSPIIQGLSTLSIFFWSLSIFFIREKINKLKIILSLIFIVFSILTYEISIALIPLNAFIYLNNKDVFEENNKIIIRNFFKLFIYSLTLIFLIYVIQNILGKYSEANIVKYGIFEENFILNIKKYFLIPFELIFINLPNLWFDGLKLITEYSLNDIFNFLIFNLLLFISINTFEKKQDTKQLKKKIYLYNICLILIFCGIFLVYLIATSVPDLNGYYNRGLLGLHIFISLFFIQFLNQNFNQVISKLIIVMILILNFNSYLIQNEIHKNNSKKRISIISKTIEKNQKTNIIFAYFKTFGDFKKNYNKIPIFSEEVWDYNMAIRLISSQKKYGNRIYFNAKCKNILNFNQNSLTGFIPSQNRKTKDLKKQSFLNKEILEKSNNYVTIINFENDKIVTTHTNNLQVNLKKIFDCN